MKRAMQLQDTINRLEKIISNKSPGYFITDQMIYGFRYSLDIELGKKYEIELLKNICAEGLPFRDIEAFNEDTIDSIYKSFSEMKKLLQEKIDE